MRPGSTLTVEPHEIGAPPRAQLFSRFVARLGGVPVDTLESMRSADLAAAIARFRETDRALRLESESLTAVLHEQIGSCVESDRRHALLAIRREIHNLRCADRERWTACGLPETLQARLERFVAELEGREAARQEALAHHESATRLARVRFREVLAHPNFLNGLAISSQVLFKALGQYRRSSLEGTRAKNEQIERGLLRYFTRCIVKTTPYSTFCRLAAGRFRSARGAPPSDSAAQTIALDHTTSHIRLNKYYCGVIMQHLAARPEVVRQLPVGLNPTVERSAERVCFLAEENGREVFREMGWTRALDAVFACSAGLGGVPLRDLAERLVRAPGVEAEPAEAESYLLELTRLGLLSLSFGISAQEVDWDEPLHGLLVRLEDPHARELATVVESLRECAVEYSAADPDRRQSLLTRSTTMLRHAVETLRMPLPMAGIETPLLEDASVPGTLDIDEDSFREAAGQLSELFRLTECFAWPLSEMASARHFFDKTYSPGAQVPLLEFYERYFREHYKDHLAKERSQRAGGEKDELRNYRAYNPFDLRALDEIARSRNWIANLIRGKWSRARTAASITIRQEEVAALLPKEARTVVRERALSFFVQPLAPLEGTQHGRLVVDGARALQGFGKYFSRFLHMMPDDMHDEVRDRNRRALGGYLSEIGGDAQFNGNLHPQLVPWEIVYPTIETSPRGQPLRCDELSVSIDPADGTALQLCRNGGAQPVHPIDLGFLNPLMRPPLYRLLSWFEPRAICQIPIPEFLDDPAMPRIEYRPRIVFEDLLILARRRWTGQARAFPWRLPRERQDEYCLRVHEWRSEHEIPERVFVRFDAIAPGAPGEAKSPPIPTKEAPAPLGDAGAPPRRRDLHKPQYVDFANPLLVALFGMSLPGGSQHPDLNNLLFKIEEALPEPAQYAQTGSGAYAAEWIIELDWIRDAPPCAAAAWQATDA